ncbi:MAG: hypothetical protein IPG96_12680 [Proteobacteria bacterium]|nr:hypothetical protein [Pseudomonadota bacterium]
MKRRNFSGSPAASKGGRAPARLPQQTECDFELQAIDPDAADPFAPSARVPPDVLWLCLPDR